MGVRMAIGDTERPRTETRGSLMAQTTIDPPKIRTMADLRKRLGGIPLERIWMQPPPGTATEEHVVAAEEHEKRLCELVDGTLVEKAMGFEEAESGLAARPPY